MSFLVAWAVLKRFNGNRHSLLVQEPATEVFTPFFNKRFDHLELLLTICRSKKSFVSWVTVQCPVSSLNASKGPSCYPKSIMFQFQICYQSHWNISCKTKTHINFKGQDWVRPPTKFWVKGLILPHKYHAPNFYQRFWHILAV